MNRAIVALALMLFLVPGAPLPGAAQLDGPGPYIGVRNFVLVMEGDRFNFANAPDTPMLEAYLGERIRFLTIVMPAAEMHTFHLHGHPWDDPDTGETVDAIRLDAGENDNFEMVAGLNDPDLAGDWFYHCHVEDHFMMGMWGIMRVYPFSVDVTVQGQMLDVRLHQLGSPLNGASLEVTHDGARLDVPVQALGGGDYRVGPLPAGLPGEVVLTAHHELGESLARMRATTHGFALVRDVLPPADRLDEVPGLRVAAAEIGMSLF